MVRAKVKLWLDRIAWSYSLISISIVLITFISYNVIGQIPLGVETWLYWLFIITGLIYPIAYVIRTIGRRSSLTKKVGELIRTNDRITAYQTAKLLEEPLWLVKTVFNKWKNKPGVVVKMGGEVVRFSDKIVFRF